MKRTHLLLAPLLLLALVACDLPAAFIPPIEVGNVFGIGAADNPTTLTAPAFQDPNELGAFLPAAIGAIDYDLEELTFANIQLPNMYGFSIDALWVTIGLGNTITLQRDNPEATYPQRFTLTGVEAHMHISDAQHIRKPAEYHFTESALKLEYVRSGACGEANTCEYRAKATQEELNAAMLFQIPERHGNVVKDLMTIISQGGENTARVKARLTADAPNGDLQGLKPTFQISNPSTKISLGG